MQIFGLLQVVVAHKRVVRWRCNTHGRAAHSSLPQLGTNAIFKMSRVLQSLERYQKEVVAGQGHHPLCGEPTLSVGTITGGLSVNTVPDLCTIEIDRRVLPGEKQADVYRHVVDFVTAETGADPAIEHEPPFLTSGSLSDTDNKTVAARLADAVRAGGISSESIGVPFGTDASTIAAAGVPSVVFGPGSIDQAHTADEWLALDQLQQASEALYCFARAFPLPLGEG